jgi:hypothetical protein
MLASVTSTKSLHSHKELQVQRLLQICEDIDSEGKGYINIQTLAKIL